LFQTVDVLVIDDFGAEAGNEGATDWLERTFTDILLDERLASKRITLFTSHFRVDELDQVYKAGRISGRIKEIVFQWREEKVICAQLAWLYSLYQVIFPLNLLCIQEGEPFYVLFQ
jgi:DNA replication protein DnaC